MKRINFSIVTLLVVAMTLLFASCTKDGVYKPKKKIAKIYQTDMTIPQNAEKILAETWTWDGKLLSKIEYFNGDIANFSYEKKQLKSITNGENRTELTYDGKLIDNMKMYHNDELEWTYTFEHGDKNRITGYTVERNTSKGNAAKNFCLVENAFRFLVPEIATNEAIEYVKAATSNQKGKDNYTVTLTYDGKNVASKTIKYEDATTGEVTYTYTEYLNPFYGLLTNEENNATSKNAVASAVEKVPGLSGNYTYKYTYKIDDKFPTQIIEEKSFQMTTGSINTNIVTDFEFVD